MIRIRDKVATKAAIKAAIDDFERRSLPISISAIAISVSISPSTIHKVYPDEAERIRLMVGRGARQQRDRKQGELNAANATIRGLNEKVQLLEADLDRLGSINYYQSQRIARLEALQRGEIVAIGSKR